jgi:hypothetical protein
MTTPEYLQLQGNNLFCLKESLTARPGIGLERRNSAQDFFESTLVVNRPSKFLEHNPDPEKKLSIAQAAFVSFVGFLMLVKASGILSWEGIEFFKV